MLVFDTKMATVRPYLLLGSAQHEHDYAMLREAGVTHILQVGSELRPSFPDRFEYHRISIDDLEQEDIIRQLRRCFNFIQKARNRDDGDGADDGGNGGGRAAPPPAQPVVLVHCMAGVSRSACVVVSYLMWDQRLPYVEAFKQVKAARPCIYPNLGFLLQLWEWETGGCDLDSWPGWNKGRYAERLAEYRRAQDAAGLHRAVRVRLPMTAPAVKAAASAAPVTAAGGDGAATATVGGPEGASTVVVEDASRMKRLTAEKTSHGSGNASSNSGGDIDGGSSGVINIGASSCGGNPQGTDNGGGGTGAADGGGDCGTNHHSGSGTGDTTHALSSGAGGGSGPEGAVAGGLQQTQREAAAGESAADTAEGAATAVGQMAPSLLSAALPYTLAAEAVGCAPSLPLAAAGQVPLGLPAAATAVMMSLGAMGGVGALEAVRC